MQTDDTITCTRVPRLISMTMWMQPEWHVLMSPDYAAEGYIIRVLLLFCNFFDLLILNVCCTLVCFRCWIHMKWNLSPFKCVTTSWILCQKSYMTQFRRCTLDFNFKLSHIYWCHSFLHQIFLNMHALLSPSSLLAHVARMISSSWWDTLYIMLYR